jgi:hypothetical protein
MSPGEETFQQRTKKKGILQLEIQLCKPVYDEYDFPGEYPGNFLLLVHFLILEKK